MPKYRVTLSDGRKFSVTTDGGPPSEADVLASINAPKDKSAAAEGLIEPGNIDLAARPKVKNPDGSTSTVRSLGVNIDGREVLIPTVVGDRVVSDDEAIEHYKRTGEHLGIFDTPEHSTAYASQLHDDYAAGKYDKPQQAPSRGRATTTGSPALDIGRALASIGMLRPVVSAAGGAGGTLVGGPAGGIAGAAAGEAAGGAIERGMSGEAPTLEAAKTDAVVGGLSQAGGLGVGKVVGGVANPLFRLATRGGSKAAADLGLRKGAVVTAANAEKLRDLIAATTAAGGKPTAATRELAAGMTRATSGGGGFDVLSALSTLPGLSSGNWGKAAAMGLASRAAQSPAVQSGAAIAAHKAAPVISRYGPDVARVLEALARQQQIDQLGIEP